MVEGGKFSMELNFTQAGGKSRRAKIQSFWEFIDRQKELLPLRPSQACQSESSIPSDPSVCRGSKNCSDNPDCESSDPGRVADGSTESESLTRRRGRTWYNELRVFKELGLDRVALAASDACKRCLRDEKNTDNDLQYADSVPQSYEELTAELKEFQERVKHNEKESKCVYQSPGKYEHLAQ